MRHTTLKVRWLLVAAVMLLSIAVLVLPSDAANAAPTTVAADFCSSCADSCWNEADDYSDGGLYWSCRDAGHTQAYCDNKIIQQYNSCIAVFCNYSGCSVPPKAYRLCKTGDCF